MSRALLRHVHALVADFAAEYGTVDVVGRRVECTPDAHDALVDTFETFGVVGGAGARIQADGRVLLVRYAGEDAWADPGDSRRPGESYRDCAERAVRETTGIEAAPDGLAQVHLLYMDDRTRRDPLPNPHVVFDGGLPDANSTPAGCDIRAGDGVSAVRWAEEVPDDLLYDELAELSLPDG